MHLQRCLSLRPSVRPSVCLSVCLSVYLSGWLSGCLCVVSVCVSVCVSVYVYSRYQAMGGDPGTTASTHPDVSVVLGIARQLMGLPWCDGHAGRNWRMAPRYLVVLRVECGCASLASGFQWLPANHNVPWHIHLLTRVHTYYDGRLCFSSVGRSSPYYLHAVINKRQTEKHPPVPHHVSCGLPSVIQTQAHTSHDIIPNYVRTDTYVCGHPLHCAIGLCLLAR
jgi:hypothetical protein